MTQRASPEAYQRLFELSQDGMAVFDDLVARFYARNPYVPGPGGDRDTAFNAGRLEVVQFILRQINRANGVDPNEHPTDASPDERSDRG